MCRAPGQVWSRQGPSPAMCVGLPTWPAHLHTGCLLHFSGILGRKCAAAACSMLTLVVGGSSLCAWVGDSSVITQRFTSSTGWQPEGEGAGWAVARGAFPQRVVADALSASSSPPGIPAWRPWRRESGGCLENSSPAATGPRYAKEA